MIAEEETLHYTALRFPHTANGAAGAAKEPGLKLGDLHYDSVLKNCAM